MERKYSSVYDELWRLRDGCPEHIYEDGRCVRCFDSEEFPDSDGFNPNNYSVLARKLRNNREALKSLLKD